MNDAGERTADRLKASELLARSSGAFLHFRPGPDEDVGRLAVGEYNDEDVVIYMPELQREEDCQVKEGGTDDG